MARIRLFAVFAIAIVAGGTFAFATYRYIQDRPAAVAQMQTRPVVVAAANLDLAAELRREDMKVIDWPAGSVPAGSFSNPQELIGRGLIQPVIQNAPILDGAMPPKEAGAGLTPVIPEGMRAVSVRVNDVIGVAGYVLPGTHVDVVATVNPTQNATDVTSKVILTNVLVLAAGTKIEQGEKDKKPIAVSVVTMLVEPEQAERLTLASTEGKIQLALRNPLDKTTPLTPGIKTKALLGAQATTPRAIARPGTVVPVAGPSDLATVEVIRGDKRAREVVRQE